MNMKRVLVVDNNPVLLRALSAILAKEGCDVRTATNGLEAIEVLEKYIPDMVFTDLIMPQVGGEQLCRIIRSNPKLSGVFLVIISAIILEEEEQILQEIDCDLCIAKGSLPEMRQHIRQALRACDERLPSAVKKGGSLARHIPAGLRPSPVTTELLSEKRHIAGMVDNLSEGVLELNQQGKIVSVNKAAINLFDCRKEEMIGQLFSELPWEKHKEAVLAWTKKQLVGGGLERLEIVETEPLRIKTRILTASFIPIQEDASVFAVCIFRDITRQFLAEEHKRELDEAVRLIKQMDAMSCMAGGFAHDFNNLLTVICGNLDILLHGEQQKKEMDSRTILEHAQRAATVAVDLVKKISCFSTFGIIRRENVQIGAVVQAAADNYFRRHGGDYDLILNGGESFVHVDSSQIEAAIHNILENAVEATGSGEIQLVVHDEEFPLPTIISGQYVPAGRYSRVDIRDTGSGIAREEILKIFDPYYSTKQRGTAKGMGLGLTIVYATMRNHGGNVVVSSEIGQGTTVSLFLPVFTAAIQLDRNKSGKPEKKCRILFVEEDEQLREIGRIMLEYLGYAAVVAADGKAAIAEIGRGLEGGDERIVIAIVDMSGSNEDDLGICHALHDLDPNLRIIASSASILDPAMEDCRKYGCVNTLPKPFTLDSLSHVLAAQHS
jgi:PAS domain S-box-containing protein